VGLDSLLARVCGCVSERDLFAREVSEGAPVVFDCSIWVAFLGGLRGARLVSSGNRRRVLRTLDGEEALIEKCFPENIERS
jgi:hypothetical protein